MLTDLQARKAKPGEKGYKLTDAGGLYLMVTPAGSKSWRLKYRIHGKEKLLTFGLYPEIGLAAARDQRDDARRLIRAGTDPALERKRQRVTSSANAELTFERMTRAWHELEKSRWSAVHAADVIGSLGRDVFPDLGGMPIRDIDTPMVLATLRKVERRGSIETARRLRQRISAVFAYAISEGLVAADPAAPVQKALKPLPKKGRQPAIVELEGVRQLLRDAEGSGASPVTKLASRLLALTSVRPGVVRGVGWSEFEGLDGPEPLWRVPASRMKLILDRKDEEAFEHLVTLSPAAVDVIETIRRLTGRGSHVFPSQRHSHRAMSENAIGYLYNRVGYHGRHVPHGWRAAFSTIMNERAERDGRHGDRKVIDLMLAHVPKDKVEGAYNRAAFMPRRREIAGEWAELLVDGLPPAGDLLDGARR